MTSVKKKEAPIQLSLFSMLPENITFSNTIELYDAIPKIILGKNKLGERLYPIEREFKHRENTYRVVIKPAMIKDAEGKYIDALPGQREEFVEDALRKIATDGNIVFVGHQVGVSFTIYQLKKELERTGHSYSYQQIKDALEILVSCNMKLTMVIENGKKEELFSESLFSRMAGKTEDGWIEGEGKRTSFVIFFNSLVKKSIFELTFRRYNYEICMQYSNAIARYMHKRMSHNYIQASMMKPYEILMSTVIAGSGMKSYSKLSENHKYISKALDEMKERKVLIDWKSQRVTGDYKYTLVPTQAFVSEIKRTNQLHRQIREAGEEAGK